MASDSTKRPGAPAAGSNGPRTRRVAHRAAIEMPAVLRLGTRDVHCRIHDLSTQGVGLEVKESLAPGMVVRVVFRLPNARQPIEITAVPVRSHGGGREAVLGLKFVEPGPYAVRAIETFVARNRSDQAFSRRRQAGTPVASPDRSESGAALDDLYREAVSEVAEKKDRRGGLWRRWLRRDD